MHLRDRKKASTEEKDRNDCVLASNCPSQKYTIQFKIEAYKTVLVYFKIFQILFIPC